MDEFIKERISEFKDRVNRMESHMESERDRVVEMSKRLDQLTQKVDDIKVLSTKLDDILRNSGKGLVYKVGNLERDAENTDKAWIKWIAVFGALASAGGWIYEIIKN